ncbi:MAG: hypothetical protein J7513_17115, partial [Solirubrobacteraceae bacterium]|nr:hypothetical protein [Solirubrobacteraceae bacterium]
MDRDQQIAAYERQFERAGLPLLIENYSASEDVFNRAFPILAIVFVGEILGSFSLRWPLWANVLVVIGSVLLATAVIALLNRRRGHDALAIPSHLGNWELAAFVLVPVLPQIVTDFHGLDWLTTLLSNLGVLLAVLLLFGFRMVSIVIWAARQIRDELASALALMVKALPLLVLFAVVLFLTTEVWQTFAEMRDESLTAVAVVISVVVLLFIGGQIPREVKDIEASVADRATTPAPPLRLVQRVNVGLVLMTTYVLQILLVTAAIFGFFVLFGMVAIGPSTMDAWIQTTGHELYSATIFGAPVRLTWELVRVALAIA